MPPERAQRLASRRRSGFLSLPVGGTGLGAVELAEQTDEVHVLMNNCYQDYAVVNARQLGMLLR